MVHIIKSNYKEKIIKNTKTRRPGTSKHAVILKSKLLISHLVVALDVSSWWCRSPSHTAARRAFMWRAESRCCSLWACLPASGSALSLVLKSSSHWQVWTNSSRCSAPTCARRPPCEHRACRPEGYSSPPPQRSTHVSSRANDARRILLCVTQ